MPFVIACVLVALGASRAASGDVILSAAGLDATLKRLDRLHEQARSPVRAVRDEAIFQTAAEADALAALINQEIASHGMQERELIDLALKRTAELGIAIAYSRQKKQFFYDGAAFDRYLQAAPHGGHAAAAEFKLLAYQFYQSTGGDPTALAAAADAKARFLTRYPHFSENAELSLYLAIDYRDLYRHFRDANDAAAAARYRDLTRREYRRIARQYPKTEQARTAAQLLRRFDEEAR